MSPHVQAFFDETTNTISYVVRDPRGRAATIIDSVLDFDYANGRTDTASADSIIDYVRQEGLDVAWLLETHVHADHLSAAPYLQEKLGGKIGIGEKITVVQDTFGKVFNEGSEFQRDGSQFEGIALTADDKLRIAEQLDLLGVHYIEGGWPGANPRDDGRLRTAATAPHRSTPARGSGARSERRFPWGRGLCQTRAI